MFFIWLKEWENIISHQPLNTSQVKLVNFWNLEKMEKHSFLQISKTENLWSSRVVIIEIFLMSMWQQRVVSAYKMCRIMKKSQRLVSKFRKELSTYETSETSDSKFDWNSNCLIISEKTSVNGFIISSPEQVRKIHVKKIHVKIITTKGFMISIKISMNLSGIDLHPGIKELGNKVSKFKNW